MGWFFKKSASFGPFRLNFSKSGIGVSAGIKGARISTGPRGTYLNLGRGGLYYRQKVGGGTPQRSYASSTQHFAETVRRPSFPTEIASRLPAYPQFPQHGLPRIVKTLGFLLIITVVIAAVGSLWFLVYFSSLAPKQPVSTSKPRPYSSPQSYKEVFTFTKGGRNLVYVVVERNLPEIELVHVAMLLHSNRPDAWFRLFDDEVKLKEFKEWEVHYSDKRYPYPKQWADTHYIADIHQASNSRTKKLEWQLGDRRGIKIASLE